MTCLIHSPKHSIIHLAIHAFRRFQRYTYCDLIESSTISTATASCPPSTVYHPHLSYWMSGSSTNRKSKHILHQPGSSSLKFKFFLGWRLQRYIMSTIICSWMALIQRCFLFATCPFFLCFVYKVHYPWQNYRDFVIAKEKNNIYIYV